MLVCPKCSGTIQDHKENYDCLECGMSYSMRENVLNLVYERMGTGEYKYDDYFNEILKIKEAEDVHFWFKNRNNIILSLFERFVTSEDHCIEIGAGTGCMAQLLIKKGYNLSVGELHPVGIKLAKEKSINRLYQFNINENPFRLEFDVVGMFDVLEHIEDDISALRNVHQMLKEKGRLILSVPAHQWLWCKDDEVSRHFRRYELKTLKDLLKSQGFNILYAKNMFVMIIPLLFLRSKLKLYSNEIKINSLLNIFLDHLCSIENKIINKLKISPSIGGTIFCVAQKV